MFEILGRNEHVVDVTQKALEMFSKKAAKKADPPGGTIPTTLTQQTVVNEFLPQISLKELNSTLNGFSDFFTRYYKSDTGVKAAEWLYGRYSHFINVSHSKATIQYFDITQGPQPNVIARIPGIGKNSNERVILGGHLDSVTWPNYLSRSPGACDDASGSSVVLEVFRVLVENGWQGSRTVEFHGYAAEEVGLLGSQAIADNYAANNIPVAGMLQLDMVGYPKPNANQELVIDLSYTNKSLNNLLQLCAEQYATIGWTNGNCGYACSDQASWTDAGYAASFGTESGKYQWIHTAQDTPDRLNVGYMSQFARMALGFVVEMGAYAQE